MKISYHSLSKKYLRKIASNIDMNVNEFIVHAYPILLCVPWLGGGGEEQVSAATPGSYFRGVVIS
jgi:hypothetical protein